MDIRTYHSDLLGEVTIPGNEVDECDSCPNCGENDADWLVWNDDGETVECQKCGRVYVPGAAY